MLRQVTAVTAVCLMVTSLVAGQSASQTLGSVTIPQAVLAGGVRLEPGTYEIRLTAESLTPFPGQSPGGERRVEFVANGAIVARDAAVLTEPESPAAAGRPPRVQMLKGGEFLRISVTRDGTRYLIHLPITK